MKPKPNYEELEAKAKYLAKEIRSLKQTVDDACGDQEKYRAEEAFKKAHKELEIRVKDRTAELAAANRRLEKEIEERKQTESALAESEKNYRQLVQSANSIITN